MSDPNRMSADEFRALGFLQEVNRRVLHPCGLAIEVADSPDGWVLGGIWDYRDDPEGLVFAAVDHEKAAAVEAEIARHAEVRRELFGGTEVQPIDSRPHVDCGLGDPGGG